MSKMRQLSGKDVLRALAALGFVTVKIRGSHAKVRRVLENGERQTLTIPIHKSIAPGTLHAIYRQAQRFIPEEELRPWFYADE